jgi:hypothetical protein
LSEINKSVIIELIKSKSSDISFEYTSGKNQKWKDFRRVLLKGEETDFIRCIKCEEVLTHKKTFGTSAILLHKCKIDNESQHKIEKYLSKKPTNHNINAIKSEITDSVVVCYALECIKSLQRYVFM